jgi:hypothetical protein
MAHYEFVEGWTEPILIELLTQGDTPQGTMTGMSVALILTNQQNVPLTLIGSAVVFDVNDWIVQFNPDPADFVAGDYGGRVEVVDTGGKKAYFPQGDFDHWTIRKK